MTSVARRNMTPYERVMDQVERRLVVPELGPCLEFTGHRMPTGYGAVSVKNVPEYAHRIVALHHYGPPPDGLTHVAHACDNRPCVEISHLSYVTPYENAQQARDRARLPRGESHWATTLTEEQVIEIYHDTRPSSVVAVEYGVQPPAVNKIRNGSRWAWLTGHNKVKEGD